MSNDPWKHRSEGMKCKSCMWFEEKSVRPRVPKASDPAWVTVEDSPTYHLGRCRRHAPTMSGFPAVFVNDWCGDHKINETYMQNIAS